MEVLQTGAARTPPAFGISSDWMATENPTWREGWIADELNLKLGIRVSPRTVRKYMDSNRPGGRRFDQRWGAFVWNHAT